MTENLNTNTNTLENRAKAWDRLCAKRFAPALKHGYVQPEKSLMPPEHVRKIVKDHGGFHHFQQQNF